MSVKSKDGRYVALYAPGREESGGTMPRDMGIELLKEPGFENHYIKEITKEEADEWNRNFDDEGKRRLDELLSKAKGQEEIGGRL